MKKIVMIGLIFSSIAAQAESYYDRTKTMFELGTLPSVAELVGINIGRCFLRVDPYSIQDGLLYGRIDNTGAGPIDANTVVAVCGSASSTGAYDTPGKDPVITSLPVLPVRSTSAALLIDNKIDDARRVVTWEVRKNGSYLVFHSGTYVYCYTFIKR